MRKLELTNEQALSLIKILKIVFKKYNVDLSPGNKGNISLKSMKDDEFVLNYFTPKHRDDKVSIHLREKETNLNLARVNIDPNGFHRNSNGEMIRGNRLLLFSSEEWVNKNDGSTHVLAYKLPSEFKDVSNIEQVFLDFLLYINVKSEGKINFPTLI